MRLAAISSAALIAMTFLFTSGCSENGSYAPIHGKVLYNDKPLTHGVIIFQPPNGPPARGTIQSDGTYVLNTIGKDVGARVGLNRVRVSCREPITDGGADAGLGPLITPKRYDNINTSGLTAEVKARENPPFEFRLTD